jgi:hypothetical protein
MLSDRLQDGVVNIGPMEVEELQRAIVEPAKKVGLRFEEGLDERILDEVRKQPGSLPLLEFLLTELWEKRRAGMLLHEAYDAIGGVRRAIAERAERTFETLGMAEQEEARWALLQLVVPGENAEDTRRRASLEQLSPSARSIVAKLATERLLVTTRDTAGERSTARPSTRNGCPMVRRPDSTPGISWSFPAWNYCTIDPLNGVPGMSFLIS